MMRCPAFLFIYQRFVYSEKLFLLSIAFIVKKQDISFITSKHLFRIFGALQRSATISAFQTDIRVKFYHYI